MLKSASWAVPLIIIISPLLFSVTLAGQQAADSSSLHLRNPAAESTNHIYVKKKKRKKEKSLSDSTGNTTTAKPATYTPYNSTPVQPAKPLERKPGAEMLRDILINKRKN